MHMERNIWLINIHHKNYRLNIQSHAISLPHTTKLSQKDNEYVNNTEI